MLAVLDKKFKEHEVVVVYIGCNNDVLSLENMVCFEIF